MAGERYDQENTVQSALHTIPNSNEGGSLIRVKAPNSNEGGSLIKGKALDHNGVAIKPHHSQGSVIMIARASNLLLPPKRLHIKNENSN